MMNLKGISIRSAERWDKFDGYVGTITFTGPLGEISVHLTDDLSRKVLGVCADQLVQATKEVAAQMTVNIIKQAETPAAIEEKIQ